MSRRARNTDLAPNRYLVVMCGVMGRPEMKKGINFVGADGIRVLASHRFSRDDPQIALPSVPFCGNIHSL